MKRIAVLAAVALSITLPAFGQTANPVVTSAKEIVATESKYIVAAFEEMPAEKYGYSPTASQMSYGKLATHMVLANTHVCAMLTDGPAPAMPKLAPTDPKDALVAAVKDSFAYCDKALAGLQDAQLGDPITFFGGSKKPRARALLELVGDLEDHYSQMAGYLRMNGLVPPSAAPKK